MSIQNRQKYIKKYQKDNLRRVVVKLNRKTDQEILEKLDSVDNVQGYIKGLILKDIGRKGKR